MEVAQRLQAEPYAIADHFDDASILFADVVDFTPLASRLDAREVVGLLDRLFTTFDGLVDRYEVEKIKMIVCTVSAGAAEGCPCRTRSPGCGLATWSAAPKRAFTTGCLSSKAGHSPVCQFCRARIESPASARRRPPSGSSTWTSARDRRLARAGSRGQIGRGPVVSSEPLGALHVELKSRSFTSS
jgi:hypothetical protein